jgi:hypothetical protein
MRRERQYLERLRQAPIPPASDDLTARLLARTSVLAAEPLPAAAHTPPPRTAVRMLALTAGSTVAAAGVLAVGAFAAAGDPETAAGAATSAALSQVSSQTPADGRTLTEEQLSRLRAEGWACPELEAMGFQLESARAVVIDGQPAVSLRLTDGSHYATVTEQHATGTQGQAVSAQLDSALELGGSSPWTATYRTPARTFTYESNLPANQADDAVPILQRLASQTTAGVAAAAHEPDGSGPVESLGARMQRGINNIVALFTR